LTGLIALVATIATFTGLDGAITASGSLALAIAQIRFHEVAIVTFFASRTAFFQVETLDAVTAPSHSALMGTGVMGFGVAIVTGFIIDIVSASIQS